MKYFAKYILGILFISTVVNACAWGQKDRYVATVTCPDYKNLSSEFGNITLGSIKLGYLYGLNPDTKITTYIASMDPKISPTIDSAHIGNVDVEIFDGLSIEVKGGAKNVQIEAMVKAMVTKLIHYHLVNFHEKSWVGGLDSLNKSNTTKLKVVGYLKHNPNDRLIFIHTITLPDSFDIVVKQMILDSISAKVLKLYGAEISVENSCNASLNATKVSGWYKWTPVGFDSEKMEFFPNTSLVLNPGEFRWETAQVKFLHPKNSGDCPGIYDCTSARASSKELLGSHVDSGHILVYPDQNDEDNKIDK